MKQKTLKKPRKNYKKSSRLRHQRKNTQFGGTQLPANMLNRKTNIRRSDGTVAPLTLAAFDKMNIAILKTFQESTAQNTYNIPIITMAIPLPQCGNNPVIVSSHSSTFLFKIGDEYFLTSPTGTLTMQHVNQTVRYLEKQLEPAILYAAGIHLIEYEQLACTNTIDLSNAQLTQILDAVNNVLQLRCPNLMVEIKPHQDLTCNTVNSYRSCKLLNDTSVLVCLTNIQLSECMASVEIFKSSASYHANEVLINSFTSPRHQGKKYNKFLRGIAICVASFIFPGADTLTSEAENPVSAKIMIESFGATPYYLHNHDDSEPLVYEEVDYTSIPLTNENREHAINVCFYILQNATQSFC